MLSYMCALCIHRLNVVEVCLQFLTIYLVRSVLYLASTYKLLSLSLLSDICKKLKGYLSRVFSECDDILEDSTIYDSVH